MKDLPLRQDSCKNYELDIALYKKELFSIELNQGLEFTLGRKVLDCILLKISFRLISDVFH